MKARRPCLTEFTQQSRGSRRHHVMTVGTGRAVATGLGLGQPCASSRVESEFQSRLPERYATGTVCRDLASVR